MGDSEVGGTCRKMHALAALGSCLEDVGIASDSKRNRGIEHESTRDQSCLGSKSQRDAMVRYNATLTIRTERTWTGTPLTEADQCEQQSGVHPFRFLFFNGGSMGLIWHPSLGMTVGSRLIHSVVHIDTVFADPRHGRHGAWYERVEGWSLLSSVDV